MPNLNDATETKLTPKQQRLLDAQNGGAPKAEAPASDATPAGTQPEAPADAAGDSEPEAPEAPEAPATQPQTAIELVDQFKVSGRIVLNANSDARQSRYNLLVKNEAAIAMLDALGKNPPDETLAFEAFNKNGECYVEVTMDSRSKAIIRRGTNGNPKAIIEGVLTVGDPVNGKATGHLVVTAATPASFLNGGARATTRQARDPELTPATQGSLRRA